MAEGRYTRIKSIFWNDEKTKLWDDETKFLALYLLTSPHNNILGCHVLPKLYICADLGWDMERLGKAFGKLIEDEFIKYDQINNLLFIVNYLKHNPIENGNQAKGAQKSLAELPKSALLQDLKRSLERLDKPFLEPLIKRLPEPNAKPVTVTIAVTETVTTTTTPLPPAEDPAADFDMEQIEAGLSSRRHVFETYAQEFGRLLSPTEVETIETYLKEFGPELVIHALKVGVAKGNRTLSYIRGILSNWSAADFKSVQDIEEHERQFQEQKQKKALSTEQDKQKKTSLVQGYEIYVPPEVNSG